MDVLCWWYMPPTVRPGSPEHQNPADVGCARRRSHWPLAPNDVDGSHGWSARKPGGSGSLRDSGWHSWPLVIGRAVCWRNKRWTALAGEKETAGRQLDCPLESWGLRRGAVVDAGGAITFVPYPNGARMAVRSMCSGDCSTASTTGAGVDTRISGMRVAVLAY
jgi:hypothetical protein